MKKPLYKETEMLLKYWNNRLSDSEKIEFENWLHQSENGKALLQNLKNEGILKMDIPLDEADQDKLWEKILAIEPALGYEHQKAKVRKIWPRLSAAAAVILMMVGGYYYMQSNKRQSVAKTEQPKTFVTDKAPGRDGAILKLADGKEIVLDNAGNGSLVQQGGTSVTKDGNVLAYDSKETNKEVLFNTLSTPVGRQFQILLPDGTKAWLNSYSSISYPTVFVGNERNVTVSGEVYMEVAKDPSKPFKVHVTSRVNGMKETTVEVLGTHFNINGYGDETPVTTTLLEGKVKVTEGNSLALLKPGQQAQVGLDRINVNTDVDMDKEIAWKNGLFFFRKEKLKSIMPQIERWYDVDVVYEGNVQDKLISGKIDRSVNLSEMLKIFSFLKINYQLEGRRLILK